MASMQQKKEASIFWKSSYGWRSGSRYIESGASAADVIRYEQEEYENELDVPEFLIEELSRQQIPARDIVWVCRTRNDARRYNGKGIGQPYQEDVGPQAFILATDNEPETGYLILKNASRLDPTVIQRYQQFRWKQCQKADSGTHDKL
jgi:hypothetical protein